MCVGAETCSRYTVCIIVYTVIHLSAFVGFDTIYLIAQFTVMYYINMHICYLHTSTGYNFI
jgi:hypothetical protein